MSSHGGTVAPGLAETPRIERAQQAIDDFLTAARGGDLAAAGALVSPRDSAFVARAAVWAVNLYRVEWSAMTWRATSQHSPLADARRRLLGDDSWVQAVTVTWSLPGEKRIAEEDLWLTFVDEPVVAGGDPTTRLAGDTDGPAARSPVPIWLQQPVRLHRQGEVLMLTGVQDPDKWLAQARAAHEAVQRRVGVAGADADQPLVVELPQSRTVFERTLGVQPGSYAAVAAAAWPMGPDTVTAPLHVVINPEPSGRLSHLGRDVLLTHEAAHVAVRSPASPAPTWLVEGYADQIAYRAHPAGSFPAEQAVREAVRRAGVPKDWPDEQDFAAEARDLDLAYDLAWTAARSIARTYGDDGLNRFYAAVGGGASLADAAAELGTTPAELQQRWRSDLERLAERRPS